MPPILCKNRDIADSLIYPEIVIKNLEPPQLLRLFPTGS